MILQALAAYYQRLNESGSSDIAPEGFERKEIPFIIVLNDDGEFIDLEDTRTLSGKKLIGRNFVVPKEKGRSGSSAWQTTNLLWDHYGYIFSIPKSDKFEDIEMAKKQHGTFLKTLEKLKGRFSDDKEINAVYSFISTGDFGKVFSSPLWPECRKIPGCNLTFRLEKKFSIVCENENIREIAMSNSRQIEDNDENGEVIPKMEGKCLVSGEYGHISRLHPRTPILGSKSNAKLVSFQKNTGFDSYGKQQSFNAPSSEKATFAYTTALNHLLSKDSRQKFQVGDATTVFWAEKVNRMESIFADIFGAANKNNEPEQDYKCLVSLFRSPESEGRVEFASKTKFYVLGLSPNAARISVRFWYAGTVGMIADNIWHHFNDLEMIKGSRDWHDIRLNSLLRSTAFGEKDEYIVPNLAGDTMKSILNGTPYPQTLLSSVLTRIKAEQSKKDNNGKLIQNVNYTRAALLKAILLRNSRFYQREEKDVNVSLDITNTNTGYLLGRLFAVVEKIQENANPGLNTTIRDHYYGVASSTPVTIFPRLIRLRNYHLAKLEHKGQVVNFEKQIGEITDKLTSDNPFPTYLDLPDQGRFAIGYYHQRQEYFTRKDTQENNIKEGICNE